MSYQDKIITELEEQNELLAQLDGMQENDIKEIEYMKASIMDDAINGRIYNVEEMHPHIRYIIEDFIKTPYTTMFNFFINCLTIDTETEVYKVCNLLLSGISYQEMVEISPLFKDFLFRNPANQD